MGLLFKNNGKLNMEVYTEAYCVGFVTNRSPIQDIAHSWMETS